MKNNGMDAITKTNEGNTRKQDKLCALGQLASIPSDGNEAAKSDDQLRDEMYEDMWAEYVALK